jgi:hypothetical protein
MKRLIRCIVTKGTQKPRERWFILSALKGSIGALEKTYGGTIEVADPSLTEEEAKQIAHNFPYLVWNHVEVNRINPLLAHEAVDEPVIYDGGEKVAPAESESEEDALRAMLDNAGVKHGRVKKVEKLREMVAELK